MMLMVPDSSSSLSGLGICLVGINYAPDSTGIAPYNTAMAAAFREAGADVHVITGIPHYPEWRVKDPAYSRGSRWAETLDGVEVTRVKHHVPAQSTLAGRARMEASFLAGATPIVRKDKSDIVIAVTPSLAGLAAGAYGRRGRPLGVLVQDLTGNAAGESGTTGGRASQAIAAYEYSLVRRADQVGIITPQFGKVLEEHGIVADRLVEIPNFTHITPSTATRDEARVALGWPIDEYMVVHTGNMGMKQGLESVVDAARHSASENLGITFVLLGDGNQRAELQSRAGTLATLRFVDPLGRDEYPLALAAADALLLNERPGVREMSLPSKLTSYTSATRPIIAAVEPGGITHSVIAADNAAVLVAPGDAVALTEAAVALKSDEEVSQSVAARAYSMHESRYSAGTARARYVAFAKLLASGGR
jgi:colanic acid biosynthesis glycosyl transferase WcaI